MKKITSLMMMLVLCCTGAFAQAATEWVNKLIKVGTAQAEMVPGQWYFVHNCRASDGSATNAQVMPGEAVPNVGGLMADQGAGQQLRLSTTDVLDQINSDQGVSANDHMNKLIRFVAVDGQDGAYYVQFGNGNYLANFSTTAPDGTVLSTVTRNQYLAGEAGKYNCYLIPINGEPNRAGRFAFNVYDKTKRMGNNGAGNTITLWSSGERIAEGAEADAADGSTIKANNVWQIFSIELLGDVDPYEIEFYSITNTTDEISSRQEYTYIQNLENGVNVGDTYGNYRTEDVAAFLEIHNRLTEHISVMDAGAGWDYLMEFYPTVEDLHAEHEAYKAADQKVRNNKIPLAVADIAPGYYTINNILKWFETKRDTIYYTQEECDELNETSGAVEGDENFLTTESIKETKEERVDAPIKALCSRDYDGQPYLAWGTLMPQSDYLWKIEKVADSETEYRLINMYRRQTFNGVPTSSHIKMIDDDTVTVTIDYRGTVTAPVLNTEVVSYSIRNTHGSGGETGNNYIHCGGHNSGAGKADRIVGWSGDPEGSRWYLAPVDDATAEQWINSDEVKVRQMITEAQNIINTVPAQFDVAKDIKTTIFENDSVVTEASQFYSPYICDDGKLEGESTNDIYNHLLDGNPATFFHTAWQAGNVATHVHYLQVEVPTALEGLYSVKLARRAGASDDHPIKLVVRGYDTNDESLAYEDGEDLGSLTFPFDGAGTWATANNLFDAKSHSVIRFYWESSNGGLNRGYWHCSAFNIFKAEEGTVHEKTQYQVRETVIARLQAAMDTWTAAEYNANNGELLKDEVFNANYTELIAAAEAWKSVYVNPADLRATIASAPADNLFVTGNNPGQWKKGSVTPTATVNEAKAYDESGAYTPEESERLIKAIADVTAESYASANKVQTDKWYRFSFPSEEMYEAYGWDKTGAKKAENTTAGVEVSPALFGKIIAAGKGIVEYITYDNPTEDQPEKVDTLATYKTAAAEELFDGNNLFFFNEEQMVDITNGEDLFRFIQATDSSYIIQNKATGLFLRGGHPVTLGVIPTYFSTKALGAGTNLITYTSLFGDKAQHCNLHGQRSDNRLVCWEAFAAGSNSALLIEEVEPVTEEPATKYSTKLWPGTVYAYTYPVDVTINSADATAYGAELVLGNADGDTAVVLKKIEAETIKAGTPYIIIAEDIRDEYITPDDRLAQIAVDVAAEKGQYGYYEKQEAAALRDEEYVAIEMDHGMAVDTLQKGNGDLVGTFRNLTVQAGKGIVARNNGFAHTIVNATVGAFGAYIKCDLDPESTDVLGTIIVDIDGSIETGITDALDKVAKPGNIYTVDGKLVGKGNINAINDLPAGIYIVNGVKVTKK